MLQNKPKPTELESTTYSLLTNTNQYILFAPSVTDNLVRQMTKHRLPYTPHS